MHAPSNDPWTSDENDRVSGGVPRWAWIAAAAAVLIIGVIVAFLVVASGGPNVTPEQAQFACYRYSIAARMGAGIVSPTQFAFQSVQQQYHLDPAAAAEVVRVARRDYCPG